MSKNDNPTPETIEVEATEVAPKRFKKYAIAAGTAIAAVGGVVLLKKIFGSDDENPKLDVNWVTETIEEI